MELGIIRQKTRTASFVESGAPGRAKNHVLSLGQSGPRRLRRLCLRALAEGEISESKAAELLRLPVSEIERVMAGIARSIAGESPQTLQFIDSRQDYSRRAELAEGSLIHIISELGGCIVDLPPDRQAIMKSLRKYARLQGHGASECNGSLDGRFG